MQCVYIFCVRCRDYWFFPGRNDKIVEIAIINLDSTGEIVSQYETLINPDRDLGPTYIHKISAEMLQAAPRFEEVMGDIIDSINWGKPLRSSFVQYNITGSVPSSLHPNPATQDISYLRVAGLRKYLPHSLCTFYFLELRSDNVKRSFLITIILTIIISSVAFAENYYPIMTLVQDLEYSSYLTSNNQPKLAYHPLNLIDEDRRTAWFEGVEGNGVGEYIIFKFLRPIDIEGINILNGYGKSSKLFYANNRIKTLEIVVNKSDKNMIAVADINEEQNIKFKAKNVSKLKLIVRDIYKGKVYDDTGFSEISFLTNIENGKVNKNKKEKIIELFDSLGRIDFEKLDDKLKKGISPQIIKEIFEREYEGLDGAGNDDRLYFFLRAIKKQPSLIPLVLKVIYDKSDNGIFVSESANEDCYVWSIKYLLDDNLVSLPLIKHSGVGFYTTYYYTLELGDTRIIPKYLDKLIETGIWHEFSCDLMPHEILIKKKDNYTEKVIEEYLNEKSMSKEVRGELKKVLENK